MVATPTLFRKCAVSALSVPVLALLTGGASALDQVDPVVYNSTGFDLETTARGGRINDATRTHGARHGPVTIHATRVVDKPVRTSDDSKVLHFQRHGEGYHNLIYDILGETGNHVADIYDPDPKANPFVRPGIADSPLTGNGRAQCASKRQEASLLTPELIVVSPLHRAIQTSLITFGSFRGKVPFVAHEACREDLGLLFCNKRRPLSETKAEFPDVDFSLITSGEEDGLWMPNERESSISKSKRIYNFLVDFVRNRPEKEIAVVGHSAWLFHMCDAVMDCGDDDELASWFQTSEIRSIRVTYKDTRQGKVWARTKHTLSNYEVAGINLATYGMEGGGANMDVTCDAEPYELFEEFNCLRMNQISGDENWWGMQKWFRHKANGRGLTFYNDKVAQKRWLPTVGIDIPKPFVLRYASELTSTGDVEDEKMAILKLLPKDTDYVAKPAHQFLSRGLWVVSHEHESGMARVSRHANETMQKEPDFDPKEIANDLAQHLHGRSSVAIQVEPGIVVEERFTAFDRDDEPALEFKVLTIWGRVHVANWRRGGWRSEWYPGVVDRNGTMVDGSRVTSLPDWVDWSRVVDIAERLGAHKDMFRVDIFVGVGAGSPALREEASDSERRKAVRYAVSEMSHISGEPFPDEVLEESVRLWIAGYKIGNYRLVPNTEVPKEFQDHAEKHSEL